ncbi:MAG: hypothetical protein Q7S24_00815 [bacterium]|nr:hypothetical protein [bacterium]
MHAPTYREALSRSWYLVWHNPFLWIFGILSMLLGQWGLGDFVGQLNLLSHQIILVPRELNGLMSMMSILNFSSIEPALYSIWLLLICVILMSVVIFVAVSSRGALIASAAVWYKQKKRLSMNRAWNEGVKNFWTLLTLAVVNKSLQAIAIMSLAYFLVGGLMTGTPGYNILAVVIMAIAIFIVLSLEAVTIFASGYAIIDRDWFGEAVVRGWKLYKNHIVVSLELGIILILAGVGLLGVIMIGTVGVMIPATILWLIAGLSGWKILIGIGLALMAVLFAMLVIVASGIFNAFTTSAWIYLFMRMHHEGVVSRVVHHLRRWLRIK